MSSNFAPGEPPVSPPEDNLPPNFEHIGEQIGKGVTSSGFLTYMVRGVLGFVSEAIATFLSCFIRLASSILEFFLRIFIKGSDSAEDSIATLASTMIDHLLGVKVDKSAFRMRRDGAARPETVNQIGTQVIDTFINAFQTGGTLEPGDAAAKKFVNTAVGMSIDAWVLDSVIGWVPHELADLDHLCELDDNLRSALGLGRMTRAVLRPALQILAATPLEWKLNKQYRPTGLSESQLTELSLRGKLDDAAMRESLARKGYSDDNINHLVHLSEKFLHAADVAFLWLNGTWSEEEAKQYLRDHGYSAGIASLILTHAKQQRIDTAKHEFVAACTEAYTTRSIGYDAYTQMLKDAGVDDEVGLWIRRAASVRREANKSRITEAKAEAAVEQGFWTIQEYTDFLQERGYTDHDVTSLQLLVQEKIRETSDAATKKKDAVKAQATAKQAKVDAAKTRQQQLDAQRAHKDLSIVQVHRAVVRDQMTITDYQDFLQREKQAPEDIQQLMELAATERDTYRAAQAKRSKADHKLAVTSLSTSQLEKAVADGALTVDDFKSILTDQGVAAEDIALLVDMLNTNLQAAAEAKTRRDAIEAKLSKKDLSLAQFERAVRVGLRTMADYKKFIAANKYGTEDQAALAGLLQDVINAEKEAQAHKAKVADDLAHKHISLAELERAVRKGLRPIGDYRAALVSNGVIASDVDTLVRLLQSQLDDAAALAKRKAEIEKRLAEKHISLAELERAARLGLVTVEHYRQALSDAKLPKEDHDVMVSLLQVDIARIQEARQKEHAAAEKLKNRPVNLADFKHAVLAGLKTLDDYRLELKTAGFDSEAQDLMVELLQEEIGQRATAEKRKQQLDAQHSQREISRADMEHAVLAGLKTLDDYNAFLVEQKYDKEDQGILFDLLAQKVNG